MKYTSLILIILALLGVSYYLEQKENVVDLSPNRAKGEKIFKIKLDDLREIHLPNSRLKVNKGEWLVTDLLYPVDKKILSELINRLNNIHVLKEINVNDKVVSDFFKYQNHYMKLLSFENEIEVRLGDVSQVTGHFYMQIYKNRKQGLYLCHDTTFFQGFYRTEEEANMQRYLGFKNLVMLKPMELIQKNILKPIDIDTLKSVSFESNSLEPFSIDIEKNTTNPPSHKNINKMNFKKVLKFHKESLFFDRFQKLGNRILAKNISSVEFVHLDGRKVVYELYGELDKKSGYFLTITDDEMVYELNAKTIAFFISQISDFWFKKLELPKTQFSGNDTFEILLSRDDKKWYKFEIYNLKSFKVRSLSPEVEVSLKTQGFDHLLQIIFARNNYQYATQLMPLSNQQKKELMTETGVFVKIFERRLFINKLNNIVYLLDLDKELVFTYVKGVTDSLSFSANEFFKSKAK